jgi:RNA-directed DNA polymerase
VIGPDRGAGGRGQPPSGPDLYSFAALWRCYRACRRTKRNTYNALAFEIDAEAKLLALQRELRDHTYRPARSICFVTDGPKPREVFAADFRDRVVHHLLVGWHQRVFEPRFIADSYACRRGKGTLAASDRLMTMLRQATANGRRTGWALHLDVGSFFPSIDKSVLYDIICRRIANPEIRWLTRAVLFHDPTAYYRFRSLRRREPPPGHPRYPVPARKSLFGKDNRCGLPIGNLTSQFWANVYLNELDQFAKRALRCRWYVRYVDDCVLLSADPDELWGWRDRIASFLSERLALRLRDPHERPQPLAGGIDFVGWHTWWNRRIPRRQTLANLRRRLGRFERHRTAVAFTGLARRIDLAPAASAALHATLASYSGHLRHGAAWQDWQREWMQRPWLDLLFARDGWMVHARWLHLRDRRVATAYGALLRAVPPGCLLFAPVGRFIETYGPQRLLAERVLRLRRVRLRGRPWAFTAGFHRRYAAHFAQCALRRGMAVVLLAAPHPLLGSRARWRPAVAFAAGVADYRNWYRR